MADADAGVAWVHAVERAYVAAATGGGSPPPAGSGELARARAAIGAVASHYLAVGTPRSLGLVVDGTASIREAALSLAAHRAWFAPRDVRCAAVEGTGEASAAELLARDLAGHGARATSLAEALACDIVCVHAPLHLAAAQLRRGTHVNVLVPGVTFDADLASIAATTRETPGLGALAAGLVDGRQLDEITLFIAGDAAIALAALGSAA